MVNSALDFLSQKYGNVVLRDENGLPSVYVPFYKMKSSDLDSSLPGHTHPAFIVNGVEQDRILISKYMVSQIDDSSPLYSVPGMPPRVSANYDSLLTRMRAFKYGASGITIADHGFILLLAKKNGWTPKGNNSWGVDYRDGTTFDLTKSVSVGDMRVFRGWEYECLISHTTDADHLPSESPTHWKPTGRHIGGTPVASQIGMNPTDEKYRGYNTLTGSGPLSWNLGSDPANLVDIQGNAFEQVYGYRLVNCEIQIMENNNAASPEADFSAGSAAWKAILPNSTDNGFSLVEPGTAGTLHWTWANSKITLDTVVPTFDNEYRGTSFKDLAVNTTNVPYIPYILQELGIFPISGDTTQGSTYVQFAADERLPRRGGSCSGTSGAGLGYLYSGIARSHSSVGYGARGRFLET